MIKITYYFNNNDSVESTNDTWKTIEDGLNCVNSQIGTKSPWHVFPNPKKSMTTIVNLNSLSHIIVSEE